MQLYFKVDITSIDLSYLNFIKETYVQLKFYIPKSKNIVSTKKKNKNIVKWVSLFLNINT